MSQLECESRRHWEPSRGPILEIVFRGAHEWTHGREMDRYLQKRIAEQTPAAIVFNLLEYEYVFGNDVGVLFIAALDRDTRGIRPVCIVATGTTGASLHNLGTSAKLIDTLRIEFASTMDSALQLLGARLAQSSPIEDNQV